VRTSEIETRPVAEVPTAVMKATLDVAEIAAWLATAYGTVAAYLGRHGVGPAGPPFARFEIVGEGRFDVEAGFPATTPVGGEGDVEPSSLPAGPAAVTLHVGPYDEVAPAYAALEAWMREHGGEPAGAPWEVYLSGPDVDPAEIRTEIVWPYRPA
jgi:effector-binding domain-containing protein